MLQGQNDQVLARCHPLDGLERRLIEIFSNAQHTSSFQSNLDKLKKLYKNSEFSQFETNLRDIIKKLLQSKHNTYFKNSCDFLCKFLQHVSKLSDDIKDKQREAMENTAPATKGRKSSRTSIASASSKRVKPGAPKRGGKRKVEVVEDELLSGIFSTEQNESTTDEDVLLPEPNSKRRRSLESGPTYCTTITEHDRLISACVDVAHHYMQVADEDCRRNAVFFVCKFLAHVETLDEEICNALKAILPQRIRDRRPMIRAQAVLASKTFQDHKMTQEGFLHHFYRDPDLVVRKALLSVMDTKIFKYDFLVDSTQDNQESMRKVAFQRLGKIDPFELNGKQLHTVFHNGLIEREQQSLYYFKTHTLDLWLPRLYDGKDLYKLLEPFNVIENHDDVSRLLELVFERDLNKMENMGAATRLHHVVEAFRERWLTSEKPLLPTVSQVDEKVIVIWLELIKFCKKNQAALKPVKEVRTVAKDPNQSIEEILDSQERDEEVVEIYERLTPDLVNLVEFLGRYISYSHGALKNGEVEASKLEFTYQRVVEFIQTYEVNDESERKIVQEVLGQILKENSLTGHFDNFIPPIVRTLFKLIYSNSSNLMINYISELIHNVRSHLEDLLTSTQPRFSLVHSTIKAPSKTPKSAKKVRIDNNVKRASYGLISDEQELEYRVATIGLKLNDLKDELDRCIKEKDFDRAKEVNNQIDRLKSERSMLHERRCSLASDVSHMSMVIETEPTSSSKFSSTMIGEELMDEASQTSIADKDEIKIFKHHTNELIKCLQMYYGCLQSVKITQVPQTMLNHLRSLTYESLDDWFKGNSRVRSLMVACNGLTALVDETYAQDPSTTMLLLGACFDLNSVEIRTAGFKSLVDIVCQHSEVKIPFDKVEKFLNSALNDYGKYDPSDIKKNEFEFITTVIEGAAKLFFLKKLSSPETLSHLILWWYHPRTHSKLKQFIGLFLPTFVNELAKKSSVQGGEQTWLKDLLEETFVTSIEYLHDYILGPGFNIMSANDMLSLISFLCNLIPISFHDSISLRIDKRMDDLGDDSPDLLKYLKQSKNSLNAPIEPASAEDLPLARPLFAM